MEFDGGIRELFLFLQLRVTMFDLPHHGLDAAAETLQFGGEARGH